MEVSGQSHDPAVTPLGKDLRNPLSRWLGWPRGAVWTFYEEMNVLIVPGFEPRTFQPIAKALRIPG